MAGENLNHGNDAKKPVDFEDFLSATTGSEASGTTPDPSSKTIKEITDDEFSDATLVSLATNLGPFDSIQLAYNQRIHINLSAAIFDTDETKLVGTGEFVHDGPDARFATALKELLLERGEILDISQWDEYKKFAGQSEIQVCNNIAELATRAYGVVITGDQMRSKAIEVMDRDFDRLIDKVDVVENVKHLLDHCHMKGISLGICTSSSEAFVRKALEYFEMYHFFSSEMYDARKKIGHDLYCQDPVVRLCEDMGVAPRNAVMFGDSITDFASAALAGVKYVVIRPPGRIDDRELTDHITGFSDQLNRACEKTEGLSDKKTTLIYAHDFRQVRVHYVEPTVDTNINVVTDEKYNVYEND